MTITGEQLDEWQALCDAATAGPWQWGQLERYGAFSPRMLVDSRGYIFGQIDDGGNGVFIAAARTAMPLLIERVRELEKRLEDDNA